MTSEAPAGPAITRLSAPTVRKVSRRQLDDSELRDLRRVAGALIPAGDGEDEIAATDIATFDDLAHEALAIMDPAFDSLIDALTHVHTISDDDLLDELRRMDQDAPTLFYALSLLVTSIYIYSPEVEGILGYPHPHRNPAPDHLIVDEFEAGLIEPVVERGSIYVPVD